MDAKRVSKALLESPLAMQLPEAMRRRFADSVLDVAQLDDARSGDVLFRLGERNTDEGLFILEGAVKVTRSNGEVLYLEAPDVLGEVQLFAPGAERTATVEIVYGGTILRFSWRELGAQTKTVFNADELAALREAIRDSASAREKNLLTSLEGRRRPGA
jgi:hypothetical protein